MKKILIVDDTRHVLEEVTDILEMEGYQVAKAVEVMEGFALMSAEIPDLIITDLSMPDIDGFTFVQQLKSSQKYNMIPIIILSANSDSITKEKAFALNVAGYLQKPCAADNLITTVYDIVG